MMNKSIKKNYIFNLMYQLLAIITPLITAPYISRVIEADGIGVYSYAQSIVSYFMLFAAMGTTIYGQREISYVQNNIQKRSEVFWNIVIFRIANTSIWGIVYFSFVLISGVDKSVYLVLLMNIVVIAVDITWFFQGIEEFQKIAVRDFIFKVIGIVCIFIFVNKREDLVIYIFMMSVITLCSAASFWGIIPKYINNVHLKELKPFKNLKVIFSLFIPTVAIQIYTVLDKTMIGIITADNFENGYYEQAMKLARMVLTIVTALGTVMIPRIGILFASGDNKAIRELMYRGYRFVWMVGVPLCFGLIGISNNLIPWFLGPGYDKVSVVLQISSLLILSIGINNVTGMQYLIPTNRQNIFTKTVLIGALANIILNALLIPHLGSIGAVIASVFAETLIAVTQLWIVRKELFWNVIIKSGWIYYISGGLMLLVLLLEDRFFSSSIWNSIVMVFTGFVVYLGLLILFRDEFFIRYLNSFLKIINKKTRK